MKAFIYDKYGPPQTLRMAEAGQPAPNAGEVLVKCCQNRSMRRTGIPCAANPVSRATLRLLRPEHQVPGVDVAGQVEAAGSGVTRFKPGDEVYANELPAGPRW